MSGWDIARDAEKAAAEWGFRPAGQMPEPTTCFHCGQAFADPERAKAHIMWCARD